MAGFDYKMDKSRIFVGTAEELEIEDIKYWKKATYKEKLMTTTHLRECFYGPKATTGRLQRFHKVIKRK